MSDWDYEDQTSWDFDMFDTQEKNNLTKEQQRCYHEFVAIMLLTSHVYDCKKCGAKKEDTE